MKTKNMPSESDVRELKGLLARKSSLDKRVAAKKSEMKNRLDDNAEIMIGDYVVVKKVNLQRTLDKDKLSVLVEERHGIDITSLMDECKKESRRETLSIS